MSKTTYYQKSRDALLNRSKEYYKNNRELIRESANNKCKLMSEYEKEIRREYHRNRYRNLTDEQKNREVRNKLKKEKYHNMNDEEKQKLKDYQKQYRENMTDEQKQKYQREYQKKVL